MVAFRRHMLLPLDACLYASPPTLPHLTRSSLHPCLQRHGISRLPEVEGDNPSKKRFKSYHIGIAILRIGEGKPHMFVAMDRMPKYTFVGLEERATCLCRGTCRSDPGTLDLSEEP